jgi:hypothetical protein
MAGDSSKSAATGLGSALVLVLLLTGVAIWQWPLESLRPAVRPTPVDRIAALQDIPARLWQDPFVATRGSDKARTQSDADKGAAPLRRPNGVEEIIDEYRKAHGGEAGEIELLAVMVNGGRSADDAENRLRTRYAVVSGILASEYAPDDPENLGLAVVRIPQPASPSQTSFSLPFEWYSCSLRGDQEKIYRAKKAGAPSPQPEPGCRSEGKRLLVLWVNNTALDQTGRPLLNLLKLLPGEASDITVIGPTNSDTLRRYVEEAQRYPDAVKGETGKHKDKRLRMLSPSATVADEVLLGGGGAGLGSFFSKVGLNFVRTVGTDEKLVASLVAELRLRGLSPPICFGTDWRCDSPNTVLLIYEADSLYARSLVDKFAQTMLARCNDVEGVNFEKCVNVQNDRLQAFTYLRGLDGESGAGSDADGQAKKADGGAERSESGRGASAAKERPHGPSQYDYLRRMSRSILDIQASLVSQEEKRSEESAEDAKTGTRGSASKPRLRSLMQPRIRAVGVIGSDTFDKLLILQAVKPLLPEATFFTVDLDARFLEADQYAWTRNLVIASNFGLELDPDIQKETAPFRDAYQSGAFLATRLALACKELEMPPQLLERPRLYEVGRGEAVDLSSFDSGSGIARTGCPLIDPDDPARAPSLHRERADRELLRLGPGAFIRLLVVCLLGFSLFWTFFSTSRDTAAWEDFAWFAFAIAAGVAAYELFYRVIISNDAEEPWRFLSGVSIWPADIVLVLTIVYCLWSGFRIRNSIRESNRHIGALFFDSTSVTGAFVAQPRRSRRQALMDWGRRMARPTWKRGAAAARGNGALWDEYLRHGSLSGSLWRALIASTVFLLAWIALTITHPPIVPVRGELSYHLEYFVSKAALLALMWLVFFVADQVRVALGFFRYFVESRAEGPAEAHSEWQPKILKRFGQSAAATGDERHLLSDYVDIRLFAERSKVIGDTVYYPFIALVLFVAARIEFFDAWTWPLALGLMVGACFVLLMLAFMMLRRAAARARSRAVQRLGRKYLELIGAGDGKKELAAQVKDALEQVQNITEGAFRPLSEEPLLRALIIPTGGLSGLGALQYLFVQRF